MDINQILMTAGGFVAAGIGYIVKNFVDRISKIEEDLDNTLTKAEVKEVVLDNVVPLKDDIKDVKDDIKELRQKIDAFFNLYIRDRINLPKGE